MTKLIKLVNWLATMRTAIVCVVFAGLVWCQDELAWQAGHKAARQEGGVAEYATKMRIEPMAQALLNVVNHLAREHQ